MIVQVLNNIRFGSRPSSGLRPAIFFRLGLTWRSYDRPSLFLPHFDFSPPETSCRRLVAVMNEALSENEQLLLSAVSEENLSQRKISRTTGLSLGMTNILLKKLAGKGYIKVVNLNGRTLRYILTPQGMQEKLRKSYDFVLRSVRQVLAIRERVLGVVQSVDAKNCEFLVLGENELGALVKEILKAHNLRDAESSGDAMSACSRVVFFCDIGQAADGQRRSGDILVNLLEE